MRKIFFKYNDLSEIARERINQYREATGQLPSIIIVPFRGGLFFASEFLYADEKLGKEIDLLPIQISTYTHGSRDQYQECKFNEGESTNSHLTDTFKKFIKDIIWNNKIRVLIIDDIIDSGDTVIKINEILISELEANNVKVKDMPNIKTMGLIYKEKGLNACLTNRIPSVPLQPNHLFKDDEWIVFPWDKDIKEKEDIWYSEIECSNKSLKKIHGMLPPLKERQIILENNDLKNTSNIVVFDDLDGIPFQQIHFKDDKKRGNVYKISTKEDILKCIVLDNTNRKIYMIIKDLFKNPHQIFDKTKYPQHKDFPDSLDIDNPKDIERMVEIVFNQINIKVFKVVEFNSNNAIDTFLKKED